MDTLTLNSAKETYEMLIDRISNGTPTAFLRIGDGEIQCMMQYSGGNCDGHLYFQDLGRRLVNVLRIAPNDMLFGLQPKAIRDMPKLPEWLDDNSIHRSWVNADALHDASIRGVLDELRQHFYINGSPVLVGSMEIGSSIAVPDKNCWLQYEHTKAQCVDLALLGKKTFLFSCGMMANVLIYEMHLMFPDAILINTGSVFDPYFNRNTRRYHAQIIEREGKK
jgi:hypothetical protein